MIVEWLKVIKKEKPTKEELRRADICNDCEFKTYSKYLDFIDSEVVEVKGYYCAACSCPLTAKVKTTNKKHICKKWL